MFFMSLFMTYVVISSDYSDNYAHDDLDFDQASFDTLADMQAYCDRRIAAGCSVVASRLQDGKLTELFEHYPS